MLMDRFAESGTRLGVPHLASLFRIYKNALMCPFVPFNNQWNNKSDRSHAKFNSRHPISQISEILKILLT